MTKPLPDSGPLTFIASPWSGGPRGYREYLTKAIHHSLNLGEVPFAPHGFYPHYLDDNKDEERERGLQAGLTILARCDKLAIYADHGITPGMQGEIALAVSKRLIVITRYIMVRGPKHGPDTEQREDNSS